MILAIAASLSLAGERYSTRLSRRMPLLTACQRRGRVTQAYRSYGAMGRPHRSSIWPERSSVGPSGERMQAWPQP